MTRALQVIHRPEFTAFAWRNDVITFGAGLAKSILSDADIRDHAQWIARDHLQPEARPSNSAIELTKWIIFPTLPVILTAAGACNIGAAGPVLITVRTCS